MKFFTTVNYTVIPLDASASESDNGICVCAIQYYTVIPFSASILSGRMVFFLYMNTKAHVCSVRFSTEEYGWLVRQSEKSDISVSQLVRKAVKMYRTALAKQQKLQKQKEEG